VRRRQLSDSNPRLPAKAETEEPTPAAVGRLSRWAFLSTIKYQHEDVDVEASTDPQCTVWTVRVRARGILIPLVYLLYAYRQSTPSASNLWARVGCRVGCLVSPADDSDSAPAPLLLSRAAAVAAWRLLLSSPSAELVALLRILPNPAD
jgi:hypothetical protein